MELDLRGSGGQLLQFSNKEAAAVIVTASQRELRALHPQSKARPSSLQPPEQAACHKLPQYTTSKGSTC